MQPIVRVLAFGVAALMVAGCSSDGTAAPTTPTAAVNATTEAATSTPSTAAPAPTSASTTTVVTTTLPATTMTTVANEDLVNEAVQEYSSAYHGCGLAPATCDPASFTATQGRSRSTIAEMASAMREQGLHFSADQRGSYVVAESVSFPTPLEAIAVYCVLDAGRVMGPLGPDGVPTVVNDQVLSLRNEYTLFLEDHHWRVGEKRELERLGEGSLCPPAA